VPPPPPPSVPSLGAASTATCIPESDARRHVDGASPQDLVPSRAGRPRPSARRHGRSPPAAAAASLRTSVDDGGTYAHASVSLHRRSSSVPAAEAAAQSPVTGWNRTV
jgi:hypothetical protein